MSVNHKGGPIRIRQIHKLPAPYSDFFFQALGDHPDINYRNPDENKRTADRLASFCPMPARSGYPFGVAYSRRRPGATKPGISLTEIGAQARKTARASPVERGVDIVLEQAAKILTAKKIR